MLRRNVLRMLALAALLATAAPVAGECARWASHSEHGMMRLVNCHSVSRWGLWSVECETYIAYYAYEDEDGYIRIITDYQMDCRAETLTIPL